MKEENNHDSQTSVTQITRKRIGLALSGGAARGMAHVGVLRILEENNIPIDFIAGTSAGSLVGGAFAAGMKIERIIELTKELSWFRVGKFSFSRFGFQSNEPLAAYVRQHFPVTKFEELPIPFAAIATDIVTGEAVVFRDQGDIATAIRASCAIPAIYTPVTDDKGRLLVDGGVIAAVPTKAVRDLGADIVIAVDVNAEGAKFLGKPQTALGIFFQSAYLMARSSIARQVELADLVISPKVGHLRWDELGKAGEFIKFGEQAALEMLDEIHKLLEA